jgi:uroporphyrin-III C-methyltransferase
MKRGLVSLVGAGPGDPDLLTLRAISRLRRADVVLYDALVDRDCLQHAPQARWSYVGKRKGRHSISQETIEKLMIRQALRGERVVRLKSGDPFVFGRGGEEALVLAAAGIPVEVVPGVSAAVAGPALSGIPLTHRDLSAAFVVVSGHAETAYGPVLSSLEPGSATVVILMGLATRAETTRLLLQRGWPASTPAAICLDASRAGSRTWRGTLAALGSCELREQGSPGLLVVGATVSVAGWLEALRGSNQEENAKLPG